MLASLLVLCPSHCLVQALLWLWGQTKYVESVWKIEFCVLPPFLAMDYSLVHQL